MGRCTACGGGGITPEMRTIRQTYATAGRFQLANYPNCTELYHGPNEGESVFMVARGTLSERLFTRKQLAEASAYSNTLKGSIVEAAATAELCHDAVVDLLGA